MRLPPKVGRLLTVKAELFGMKVLTSQGCFQSQEGSDVVECSLLCHSPGVLPVPGWVGASSFLHTNCLWFPERPGPASLALH